MSNPSETFPTPISEFQAHFGAPPGALDAKAECEKWQRLCAELIVQRQRLREELAKAQADRDASVKAWLRLECENFESPYTREELFSFLDQRPTIQEVIEELERARKD